MKLVSLFVCTALALAAAAKDLTLAIDTTGPARDAFPHDAPCVGYAADPQVGDEEAVLACRRAGAWLFRSSRCDDATLAFAAQYGLRLFVVLDGDLKTIGATLARLGESPHKKVVAGLQLGAEPSGGADPTMWRRIAETAARKFRGTAIALPVKDLDSPLYAKMAGYLGPVSHLIVDLRDAPAPYERLEAIAAKLRRSQDKSVAKLRLWAVGPGRLAGTPDDKVSAPAAVAWQMHWIMSALAVNLTDGVFIERPCRADDFGRALRHLWAVTTKSRLIVGHGEGATAFAAAQKKPKAPADVSLDDEGGVGDLELNDATSAGCAPTACANVAAGKTGDVEYLVLAAPPVKDEGRCISLVVVNTSGEHVKLSVDVDKKGGNASGGFRRRLVPDAEKGEMRDSTRQRGGKPLAETVESGEVTFFDFRI